MLSYESLVPADQGMRIWDAVRWRCLRSLARCIPLPWIPRFRRPLNYSELAICERSLGFEFWDVGSESGVSRPARVLPKWKNATPCSPR